jgi:Matrixin/Putative peptidoglycan binding domain
MTSLDDRALLIGVQRKLEGLGFLPTGPALLELDDRVRAALRNLQGVRGIPITGELDSATLAALFGPVCGRIVPEGVDAPDEFVAQFTLEGTGPIWNKLDLTYQFAPLPPNMAAWDIIGGINQALQAWSAVSPFRFSQTTSGADFSFRFDGQITLANGTTGPFPAFAVAFTLNNQISFNPAYTFSSTPGTGVVDIVSVTLHELGHLLGVGHSANLESVMYFKQQNPSVRALSADDIEGIQSLYGAPFIPVPGWFGHSTSGADLVINNFQQAPTPPRWDVIVGQVDNPGGPDTAFLRVGWGLDANGFPTLGWGPIVPFGGPLGYDTQGMALATGFIGGGLTPAGASALDLVMAWMDNPAGENQVKYRIGFNLDSSGMMPAAISPDLTVPGPWGHETAGLAAAVYDISGSGLPDLVIAWIDDPDGENRILYKIGFDIGANGMPASWSPQMQVGGWTGSVSAGLGISVGDFRGNGRPDLAVFWIDDPDGENSAYVRIGRDLDPTGFPLGGWAPERKIPGWWGTSTGGAGAAFTNLRGLLRPDLVVLNLDAPENDDRAYYRVLSPPLATWNVLRRRTSPPGRIERIASVSPSDKVIVAGVRAQVVAPAAQAGVTFLVWDQTDLNEDLGSDILEFVASPTLIEARPDSPIAVASRIPGQVDGFWIGPDDQVRTTFGTNFGETAPTGALPTWPAAGSPLPNTLFARASSPPGPTFVPPSPLAAASIHPQHIGVFFVGREDEILTQAWSQTGGWGPAARRPGPWARPVTALAAEVRGNKVFVYWVDGAGAVWELQVNDQNVTTAGAIVAGAGSAAALSNIAAVSKNPDHMDLFWINPSGRVFSTFWTTAVGAWAAPFDVASGRTAALPSSVTCVNQGADRVQAFWEEADRSVWTTWWTSRPDGVPVAWSPPAQVLMPGTARGGLDMVAVSRQAEYIRLFLIDNGRQLAETHWGGVP